MVVASLHQPNDLTLLYNCRVGGEWKHVPPRFSGRPMYERTHPSYLSTLAVRTDRRRLILCAVCETDSFAGKRKEEKTDMFFSRLLYSIFGNLSVASLGIFARAVVLAIKKKNPFLPPSAPSPRSKIPGGVDVWSGAIFCACGDIASSPQLAKKLALKHLWGYGIYSHTNGCERNFAQKRSMTVFKLFAKFSWRSLWHLLTNIFGEFKKGLLVEPASFFFKSAAGSLLSFWFGRWAPY